MVVTAVTSAGLAARYQHKGDQLKIALIRHRKQATIGFSRSAIAEFLGSACATARTGTICAAENILSHEFGHGIESLGLSVVDPTF